MHTRPPTPTTPTHTHTPERRQQDIRLVGDTANGQGVVELFDTIYRWVTICPSASVWGAVEANASCMQLGYDSGTPETYRLIVYSNFGR